ncbi:MAG: nucleotidyltransferase substrate binding protein [Oscillospiraceae bacterium]|nr:nucleotidyltransferase substrate binding protein [Oscillospiraceae bacterium]
MNDIRWKQRHINFSNILRILIENLAGREPLEFTELERVGLAKSFELSFELLWKLLKDFLEHEEVEIGLISPKNTLKAAAVSGLLEKINTDGDVLMQALISRNELMHVYENDKFTIVLEKIKSTYLPEMVKIDEFFKQAETVMNDLIELA